MELIHFILLAAVCLAILAFAGAKSSRSIDKITDRMMED